MKRRRLPRVLNQLPSESRDDRLYVERRRLFNRGVKRRRLIAEGRRLYNRAMDTAQLLKMQETQS